MSPELKQSKIERMRAPTVRPCDPAQEMVRRPQAIPQDRRLSQWLLRALKAALPIGHNASG